MYTDNYAIRVSLIDYNNYLIFTDLFLMFSSNNLIEFFIKLGKIKLSYKSKSL